MLLAPLPWLFQATTSCTPKMSTTFTASYLHLSYTHVSQVNRNLNTQLKQLTYLDPLNMEQILLHPYQLAPTSSMGSVDLYRVPPPSKMRARRTPWWPWIQVNILTDSTSLRVTCVLPLCYLVFRLASPLPISLSAGSQLCFSMSTVCTVLQPSRLLCKLPFCSHLALLLGFTLINRGC